MKARIFYCLVVLAIFFTACESPTQPITYPDVGTHGDNILSDNTNYVIRGIYHGYSMRANVPDGQSLRIVLKGEKTWWIEALPNAPVNWIIGQYDNNTQSQTFTVMEGGRLSDLRIGFFVLDENANPQDYITIEYFENDAVTPTRVRKLELRSQEADDF